MSRFVKALMICVLSCSAQSQMTVGISQGWNLVGNGSGVAIEVNRVLNNSDLVTSVWTWDVAGKAWNFYTPKFADGGASYAASKLYQPLATISKNQGFWINAAKDFELSVKVDGAGTLSTAATTSSTTVASTTTTTVAVNLSSPQNGEIKFQYYRDGSTSNPVSYIHPRDIDGDGVDEIFFVSFETQPNTPNKYSNTSVHILGWENGVFREITSKWLPGNSNQVEGVGDICFGDFNGDGKIDVFLSAYTDMNHPVQPYALMNQGSSFTKIAFSAQTWMHGVTCADINKDGFDDVLVTGYSGFPQYIGSATGLTEYQGMVGGSGVTAGDFLGNGSIQVIVVDSDGADATKDTKLLIANIQPNNKIISFDFIANLPGPRLDILYTDPSNKNSSHDIRARAVDFNLDGNLDVIVFSYRYGAPGTEVLHRSEIQFLKNKGGGVFEDVTDSIRMGYDTSGGVGYVPVIRDFNGDGLVDVFVSGPDWLEGGYKSSSLLIQNIDGKFVNTAKSTLNTVIESGGGQATIARGPSGVFYLVKESSWKGDGWTRVVSQSIQFR